MEYLNNFSNKSAEQSLLAEIMCDNTILEELDLNAMDFCSMDNRTLFVCINELYQAKSKVDTVTIYQKLKDKDKVDDAGGMQYLLALDEKAFTSANWKSHADIIKSCSSKRFLRDTYRAGLANLEADMTPDEVASDTQQRLSALESKNADDDNTADVFDSFEENVGYLKEQLSKDVQGLKSGFIDLDKLTGGFNKSDLIILAARPAMGKTAFALNIAKNVGLNGGNVLVVSLEMGARQLINRVQSSVAGVDAIKFRTPNKLSQDEWKRLESSCRRSYKGSVIVWDKSNANVQGIKRKARQMQHSKGLDLIIVDYLQLMEGDKKSENRTQQVSAISRGLKLMARELDVPVIVLSQLNRGLEERRVKKPMLSDLRESGSIEQDADLVMFLYRESYYDETTDNTHTELILAKHRHGPIDTVNLWFDEKTTTFVSLSKENYHQNN